MASSTNTSNVHFGPTVFEPTMRTPIDLHELAKAIATIPWLIDAATTSARDPNAIVQHPLAQRLGGDFDAVEFAKLLVGESRTEVGVVGFDERNHALTKRRVKLAVAWSAALLAVQASGPIGLEGLHQPPNLPNSEPENLGRLGLRHSLLAHSGEDLQPVQFLLTHQKMPRGSHRRDDYRKRTFLNGTNRTLLTGAYTKR